MIEEDWTPMAKAMSEIGVLFAGLKACASTGKAKATAAGLKPRRYIFLHLTGRACR